MYDMKNLSKLKQLGSHRPDAMRAFQDLSQAAFGEGDIPSKYKELIAVAVAVSKQCTYCIESHRGAAIKAGATETELAEAIFIASAIGAGAAVTHGTHLIENPTTQRSAS